MAEFSKSDKMKAVKFPKRKAGDQQGPRKVLRKRRGLSMTMG
jgi:hypothetical protein